MDTKLFFLLKQNYLLLAMFVISILSLGKANLYYGTLLRGWDAQFYYSTAHSIVFDQDFDITNNIEASPFQSVFERNPPPKNEHHQITSKYPILSSLIEIPFLLSGSV